jgi:hypothetical protein
MLICGSMVEVVLGQQRSDHVVWRGMLVEFTALLANVHFCTRFWSYSPRDDKKVSTKSNEIQVISKSADL